MDLGSIFLILALAILVGLFVSQPFQSRLAQKKLIDDHKSLTAKEHLRSSLLAERDRLINTLQELEFDFTLGKIPAEDYPVQRAALLKAGADTLRQLDEIEPAASSMSAEDRVEAAVAARRADAKNLTDIQAVDDLEKMIAARRQVRQEKSAGFCPKCGTAVQQSDVFCSRCGQSLQ